MYNAESLGCVKFDFLGVVALDKLWMAQDLINGELNNNILGENPIDND